jgi:hypothetical protein
MDKYCGLDVHKDSVFACILDSQLQRCNIRFSNDVSNQGNNVSFRKIVNEIIGGESITTCPPVHSSTRPQKPPITSTLLFPLLTLITRICVVMCSVISATCEITPILRPWV